MSSFVCLESVLEKISEITLQIQQRRDLAVILQGAIATARTLLQTDRVFLYRFLNTQDAVVAFESMGSEWPPILGQQLYEPCVQAVWIERYRPGETASIAHIHDETLDPYQAKLLEHLPVKANLVIPIESQDKIWGLLIVHHYRSPRAWESLEVQFLQHMALLLGIAIQQAALSQPTHPPEALIPTLALNPTEVDNQSLRERLQFLVSASPAVIYSCPPEDIFNCTFISDNVSALLGYTPADFLNSSGLWGQCLHPDDVPRLFAELPQLLEEGYHLSEYRFRHKAGHYCWVQDEVKLVRNAAGEPVEWVGCLAIIDDRKAAKLALQESEERFQEIANTIPQMFFVRSLNPDRYDYVSPAYETIWGRSRDELLQNPYIWMESIHPEDRAQVEASLKTQIQGNSVQREYRIIRPDGSVRWIMAQATVIRDESGQPIRFIGLADDISDRKAAATALEESQQQYKNLLANSPDIIERFDLQLRHLYVSAALTQLSGIPVEEFLGKTCRDLGMDAAMVQSWEDAAARLLATGERQTIEFEILTLNGMRSFEMVIAPELSEQQTIESILCISRDVTDRKATEAALIAQQQFTERIAESTLAILYVYDLAERRNIYCSQQIEAVLGYTPQEIADMGDTFFPLLIHPDDLPGVMVNQQRLLQIQDDEFVETEYRMRHKSGTYRWLLSRDRIFSRTTEGASTQILGVATDITLQKEIQASLRQQAERQRLLTVIAQHIRQTLDLEHILQTTVTEVRQFLHTDRVIIYQFEPDWSGFIIAESVAEGWQSILGMQITDTYFVENQGQPYEKGCTKAINDIYTANLDPCHIVLLEQMQVRAKLVVPILQEQQLWGLLVAQHCQSPRFWESLEIELQQQLATQLGIAIQQADLYRQANLELAERQRAEAALQRLNQELEQRVQERTQALQQQANRERLLRLIIQNIHGSLNLDEILETVLRETRHTLQADRVAIYQFNPDWSGNFVAESVGEGWIPLVNPTVQKVWEDTHLQRTQGGRYRHNESFAVNDIYTVGHQRCHLDLLEQFQARAYAIAPIFLDDELWGLLAVYQNSAARIWQDWEISLLEQIAIQMAIALRQSHLYQAVQAQVHELERLNQLKDDFLSTVSHELRSPMSNIKMATEMLEISLEPLGVFDHEFNPINRYLKILREEGHREANLINDLLDLARLDAGTELINPITIDLQSYIPHVAEAFLERASHQHQHLVLNISATLPPFTTDLSFLERILTELLHNACKYTPAGETITVSADSTAGGIAIHVSNSGIEIPADECDRIFDKFYRIPNNDPWKHGGTGLGLALVKKLTERLGGQIRVESGKGQTTFIMEFGCYPASP